MIIDTKKAVNRMISLDAMLAPFKNDIAMRIDRRNDTFRRLMGDNGDLKDFSNGYRYFGFQRTENGWFFREWLPGADAAWLTGDFNGWARDTHPLTPIGNGVWEGVFPDKNTFSHGQYIRLIVGRQGQSFDRLPAYIRRAPLDTKTNRLCGQIWMPEEQFKWSDEAFRKKKGPKVPLIYEAHIGMAQEKYGVGTYLEFADNVLPRVKKLGYNTIQFMAIQEHPYYASFGYQVTNFFAPSYRFGTPEDLKTLIDRAHQMGISVIMDVVHSHACPNVGEGLYRQDGTEDQYFLYGGRGWHPAWGTNIFNYGKTEVLHFLLSNLKYYLEEFHFDGFRFDGVTSMCYEDHGLGVAFTDYSKYYTMNTNIDALVYLQLANELIHEVRPGAVTIAEDMSGMPGMCLTVKDGGIGFDYRLNMGIPDQWIRLLKEANYSDWDMFKLYYELTTGRPKENRISYCESHDQALVGDKTIIFRMADAAMYTEMNKDCHEPVIDTAIDLHKIIRFVTAATAGGGYLNFMGNEFGHPDWIDVPREGNGWSYHYARRQWSLADNPDLKYQYLDAFDAAMIHFLRKGNILSDSEPRSLWIDQLGKTIAFERKNRIFLFNFNTQYSDAQYLVHLPEGASGSWKVTFSSDDSAFGGLERIDKEKTYSPDPKDLNGFRIYLPCRTALVLEKTGDE